MLIYCNLQSSILLLCTKHDYCCDADVITANVDTTQILSKDCIRSAGSKKRLEKSSERKTKQNFQSGIKHFYDIPVPTFETNCSETLTEKLLCIPLLFDNEKHLNLKNDVMCCWGETFICKRQAIRNYFTNTILTLAKAKQNFSWIMHLDSTNMLEFSSTIYESFKTLF